MRRFIHTVLCFIVVLTFLPGCVKDVPSGVADVRIPLRFQVSAQGQVTRSVPGVVNDRIPVGYDTRELFSVYALDQDKPFADLSAAEKNHYYIDDVACSYNGDYGAWEPVVPYYWLPDAVGANLRLTFQAYSPSVAGEDCAGGAVTHSWTGGLRFTGFTPREPGSQYDLLYSDLHVDKRRPDYTPSEGAPYDDDLRDDYNGIDLYFRHALSWITLKMKAKVDEDAVQSIRLQKVSLVGVWDRGDFDQRLGNPAGAVWTIPSGALEREYVVYENTTGDLSQGRQLFETDGSPESDYFTVPVALMVVPQPLLHAGDPLDPDDDVHVGIEVTYTRTVNATGRTIEGTLTADLVSGNEGGYYTDGTDAIEAWEPGMHYTYRVVINLFKIFVDPTVSDWEDYDDTVDDHIEVVTGGHAVDQTDYEDPENAEDWS